MDKKKTEKDELQKFFEEISKKPIQCDCLTPIIQEMMKDSEMSGTISEEEVSRMFMNGRCGYSQAVEDMKLIKEGKLEGYPN